MNNIGNFSKRTKVRGVTIIEIHKEIASINRLRNSV